MPDSPYRPLPPTPGGPPKPNYPPPQPPGHRGSAPAALGGNQAKKNPQLPPPPKRTPTQNEVPGTRLLADVTQKTVSDTQQAPQKDILSRVAHKKWNKKGQPMEKGVFHYSAKWTAKRAKNLRKAIQIGLSTKQSVKGAKANRPFQKQAPVASGIAKANILFSLKHEISNLYENQKEHVGLKHRKQHALSQAKHYQHLSQTHADSNPKLALQYAAMSHICQQTARRCNLVDSFVERSNIVAGITTGVLSGSAIVGAETGLLTLGVAGTLTAVSGGIGAAALAGTFFGYGTYKFAEYTHERSKTNHWECSFRKLETQSPDQIQDSKHCQALKKKMVKKKLLDPSDEKANEKMRIHAFNQCLQRKSSFATGYLREMVLDAYESKDKEQIQVIRQFLKDMDISESSIVYMENGLLPLDNYEKEWDHVQEIKDQTELNPEEMAVLKKQNILEMRDKTLAQFFKTNLNL